MKPIPKMILKINEKELKRLHQINQSIANCFKHVKLDEYQLNKIRLDKAITDFSIHAEKAILIFRKIIPKIKSLRKALTKKYVKVSGYQSTLK